MHHISKLTLIHLAFIVSVVGAFGLLYLNHLDQMRNVHAAENTNALYVDKDSLGGPCNDTYTGSFTLPLCTITKAVALSQPGMTIYVRKGIYKPFLISQKSGLSSALITFTPYNGEAIIIDATGMDYGIKLDRTNYIEINGFEVKGAKGSYSAGIWVVGNNPAAAGSTITSTNNVIKNNNVHDNTNTTWIDGILVQNSSYNRIEGNQSYKNAVDGIKVLANSGVAVTGNVVSNNSVHDNNAIAGQSDGIGISGDKLSNTRIENNIVFNNGDDGIDTWNTHGNTIMGNISYANGVNGDGNGFKVGGSTTGGFNVVMQNISYGNLKNGFDSNGSSGNRFYNNVSYNNKVSGFEDGWRTAGNVCYDGTTCYSTFINNIGYNNTHDNFSAGNNTKVSDYNVWYSDNGGAKVQYNFSSPTSLLSFQGTSKLDLHSLSVNPQFINPAAADFHVLVTSPAIDRGDFNNPAAISLCGGGVDIGRYEYCVGQSLPTAVPSVTSIVTAIPTVTIVPTVTPVATITTKPTLSPTPTYIKLKFKNRVPVKP